MDYDAFVNVIYFIRMYDMHGKIQMRLIQEFSAPRAVLKALTVMPRILRNEPKKTLTIDVQTMN